MVELCPPHQKKDKVLTPIPQNVTLFGNQSIVYIVSYIKVHGCRMGSWSNSI